MVRIFIAAGLLACAFAQPVSAEPTLPSERVDIAGLDLSTDLGRAKLDGRIRRAVMSVCGETIEGHAMLNATVEQCRAETLAKARQDAAVLIAAQSPDEKLADRGR